MEMRYAQTFDAIMPAIHRANLWRIWNELFKVHLTDIKSTNEKLVVAKNFFEYAIFNNQIIECDRDTKIPVFSRQEPDEVAERFLADFPLDKLPDKDVENDPEFYAYATRKNDVWVTLIEGTTVVVPD